MSEANNNATSFSSEFNLESFSSNNSDREPQNQATADNQSLTENQQSEAVKRQDTSQEDSNQSLDQKMDWHKVAHKLREYNRKLLKKVFRLEQELAEIDNRFNKYVEKSQNSDLLLAKQEEELQNYQKQIALLTQHLTTSQKEISNQEITIKNLSQQYELSQQQTAQLERDCTLLQESYSQKNYELTAKEKETKELQTRLNQQQRSAIQYKAELKRYQEQAAVSQQESASNKSQRLLSRKTTEPALSASQNYSNKNSTRSIQPWSSTTSESKIVLPKTKPQSVIARRLKIEPSETVQTAAEIATWSASQTKDRQDKQATKTKDKTKAKAKSTANCKPQSLAAIDLPTFPRPM